MYKTIKNIYKYTYNCVQLDQFLTDWFISTFGVRQGDVLSSTLFSVYINDLVEELKTSGIGITLDGYLLNCLLYADDIALMAESEEDLQRLISIVHSWCRKWQLIVNIDKTRIIHFRKSSTLCTPFDFKYGTNQLTVVPSYKYLGCVFNETLDFTLTCQMLSESAGRALGAVISKMVHNPYLYASTFKKLYDTHVIPIIDYCSGVWGFKVYENCEKLQNKAIRFFLGVHRFTSNVVIHGDTAWLNPHIRRKLNMLKLWNRILSLNDDRLTKIVLMYDINCHKKSWSYEVKQILIECNLEHIFVNLLKCDHLIDNIKHTLLSNYVNTWQNNLESQRKLRVYKTYKTTYEEEMYVHINLSRYHRSILARLRS